MACVWGWDTQAVEDLLMIWGQERVQEKLQSSYRNREVYDDIKREMNRIGHQYTMEQCRSKIKTLKKEYRQAKLQQETSGVGKTRFRYVCRATRRNI